MTRHWGVAEEETSAFVQQELIKTIKVKKVDHSVFEFEGQPSSCNQRIGYPKSGTPNERPRSQRILDGQDRPGSSHAAEASGAVRGSLWNGAFVVMGSSTGGVEALEIILSELPVRCPPVLITQHMPERFLRKLANRLDQRLGPEVRLVDQVMPLEPGRIYIGSGGDHHLAVGHRAGKVLAGPVEGPTRNGHRPSVDVLFRSARPFASRVVGVVLTGMGCDGASELLELREAGAQTIAESQKTALVYGMPKAAIENGAAAHILPRDRIAARMLDLCKSANQRDYSGKLHQ